MNNKILEYLYSSGGTRRYHNKPKIDQNVKVGFDTKILRSIIKIRKQDANERMEQEAILELYMSALNMQ